MQPARARYLMAIAAMVVGTCFLYLVPLVPQAVIDGVLDPQASKLDDPWVGLPIRWMGGRLFVADNLWVPAVTVAALSALAGVAVFFRQRWAAEASETIIRNFRNQIFDHLQRLPCRYFDSAHTGDIIQRCTSDVETVRLFLATHVVEIARSVVMFVVPLPLMLLIDVRMTVVAALLLPAIVVFSTWFFLRVRKRFEEVDEAEGELTTSIQENLSGIRVVRAFGRHDHEVVRFGERNRTYRRLDNDLFHQLAIFWSISDLLTFLQQALVVGAGIYWVTEGSLSVGAFFYFLTAVVMFIYPLRQMGRILADLGKATVALDRVGTILAEPKEATAEDAVALPEVAGDVVFDDVTFSYGEGAAAALTNFSLRIPARSTVAIVGPSGSGKTTLVSLLLRLYDPQEGAISIGGRDLRTLDRHSLRRHLSVALQEPFLFSKTVDQNLRLGRAEATFDEVEAAVRVADVHATIHGFDQGYETMVGERGVTLSGGQRQRVALARALLQKPQVLIMDDALSAVDTATETEILGGLRERRGQQTTIIIAHRMSTLALADHIVVLDDGQIRQQGSHRELMGQPGPYADLWRLQSEQSATLEAS
ncbi:MAG: ABC transporter ATP-binding protein [Myxococcota bacterium]